MYPDKAVPVWSEPTLFDQKASSIFHQSTKSTIGALRDYGKLKTKGLIFHPSCPLNGLYKHIVGNLSLFDTAIGHQYKYKK